MKRAGQPTIEQVARALAEASWKAGQAFNGGDPQDVETRAANLLKEHVGRTQTYTGYVVDPAVDDNARGWAPDAVAVVYCEQIGDPNDCIMPLDYHGDGHNVAHRAQEKLGGGWYFEWVNCAICALVSMGD